MRAARRIAGFCLVVSALLAGPGCGRSDLSLHGLSSPAGPGSAEPNLAVGGDGRVYLSWVQPEASGHTLRVAVWDGGTWGEPRVAARGDDWFVNWADVPSVGALEDGTLFAQWLARSGTDPYAYGVRVAISSDGGATWNAPVVPHRDSTDTEHGFVSMAPVDRDHMGLVWLDGREMAGLREGDPGAVMTLRYATLDRNGTVGDEALLDPRVCDCCATSLARTRNGSLLVIYRDRSETEIRDIAVVRGQSGTWSGPEGVARDDWKIPGCPVNGPVVATDAGGTVAVWFTGAQDRSRVRVAFSADHGETFGPPFDVDDGQPLGRVDAVMASGGGAIVSWLEAVGDSAVVRIRRVDARGPAPDPGISIPTSAERASGFPQLAPTPGGVLVAWTALGDGAGVRTAIVR